MGSDMDLFDDFEFKPLTEGLGFHKKPVSLKEEVAGVGLYEKALPKSIPNHPSTSVLSEEKVDNPLTYEDLLQSLSKTKKLKPSAAVKAEVLKKNQESIDLTSTLPRQKAISPEPARPHSEVPRVPFDDIQKKIETPRAPINSHLPTPGTSVHEGVRRSSSNSPVSKLKKAPICLRSIFLDAVTVLAISLLFAISLLYVTKVSVPVFIYNLKNDIPTQVSFGLLFVALYQIYVIVSRSFFTKTLGEWTFDFQLGNDEEQQSVMYPIRVVWRSTIIVLTGVVVLPTLSFIIRRDVAGFFSGVQLYRLRNSN